MLRSIPVVDETIATIDCGNLCIQKITWFHIIMARDKIFLFLHCYQPPTMSSLQTMVHSWSSYPGLWKFEAIPDYVLENRCLTSCFSPHVNVYNFSFHYNIYIESCVVFITYSPDHVALRTSQPSRCHYTIDTIGSCLKQEKTFI